MDKTVCAVATKRGSKVPERGRVSCAEATAQTDTFVARAARTVRYPASPFISGRRCANGCFAPAAAVWWWFGFSTRDGTISRCRTSGSVSRAGRAVPRRKRVPETDCRSVTRGSRKPTGEATAPTTTPTVATHTDANVPSDF